MENVVLVIHLFLALAIIGLVLLQRSEGGGLGIGGGGGGLGRLATPRGTANFLTRATGFCAAAFFATSLLLGILAGYDSQAKREILDIAAPPPAQEAPVETTPAAPTENTEQPTDKIVIPPPDTPAAPIAE